MLRAAVGKHPYFAAFVIALGVELVFIRYGRNSIMFSAWLVGCIVGANRVSTWPDIFKKFPGALLSFVLACWIMTCAQYLTRGAGAEMESLGLFISPFLAVLFSPIILIGELLGWRTAKQLAK